MSCYLRHMSDIIAEAGIENTKENRKKIDCYLKEKYNLPQHVSSCPDVWKFYIKPLINDEKSKTELITEIRRLFKGTKIM